MNPISNMELSALELHDQSIESIQLDFSLREVYIKVSYYNEARAGYSDLNLIFKGIELFTMSTFSMNVFDSAKI